jgi:GTP-binding protein
MMTRGVVVLVGRPNVGKSSLFNALTREKTAIVDATPGVTRDFIQGSVAENEEKSFVLMDTGGYEVMEGEIKKGDFDQEIVWEQTIRAVDRADLVLFLLDGKAGCLRDDITLLHWLKKKGVPFLPVVNKIDGIEQEVLAWEFFQHGVVDPYMISALHKRGLGPLLDEISERVDGCKKVKFEDTSVSRIAIIGRPNAGKSSILNRLVGEERMLVSEVPGTTRDAVDTEFRYKEKPYVLVDTAGIRRRPRISEHIESESVHRSLRAIQRCDIVLLVVDISIGVSDQDMRLLNLSLDRGKPVLLVLNKWDLIPEKKSKTLQEITEGIRSQILKAHAKLPIHVISCATNHRVSALMEWVQKLEEQQNRKIPTSRLNEILKKVVSTHSPRLTHNYTSQPKFFYMTQVQSSPITFLLFCKQADKLQKDYQRFLLRKLQEELDLEWVPVRLLFRSKERKPEEVEAAS